MRPLRLLWTMFSAFFSPALTAIADNGGKWLETVAHAAVLAADATEGDGDAKRQAAFKTIENAFKQAGKVVIPWVINLAIELAVAKLKAK